MIFGMAFLPPSTVVRGEARKFVGSERAIPILFKPKSMAARRLFMGGRGFLILGIWGMSDEAGSFG